MPKIHGQLLDQESRCIHYHSQLDIVALKCWSCKKYYACFHCHDALENHSFQAYPKSQTEDLVVICGICKSQLTIAAYQEVTACPKCNQAFNPKCKLHAAIYFKEE